jgi:ABC-2 type transport system ATP-binding protein
MTAILDCQNLSKSFAGLKALNNISFIIHQNTSTGLVGPNGAGKTTLLSMLCGFLRSDTGTIQVAGRDPHNTQLKGHIGIQPQDTPMMRGIPASDQLLLFTCLQGYTRQTAHHELERIINLFKISDIINQYPETMSYGQRKKIALAQAIIGKPEIILLDEPTSGLDPVAANDVRNIIQALRSEHTFLISSHNLDEIKTICDEVIIIDKGKLIRHCRIDDLVGHNNTLTVLLEQTPPPALIEALNSFDSIVSVQIDPGKNKSISICFQGENPGEMQYKIFECLKQNGASIVEFSRGSVFTDKIVEIVSKG